MITIDQARKIIAAGEDRANEIGVHANIAVLDSGVHLKAFSRMDGALLGSIDIAISKARTAALFGKISWWWFVGVLLGVVLIFGAPQIVTWIRGMFGV